MVNVADKVAAFLACAEQPVKLRQRNAAEHLGISENSIRKRLWAEGTNWHDLRDTELKTRAYSMMLEGRQGKWIAYELGYSQPRPFYEQYAKWYGHRYKERGKHDT